MEAKLLAALSLLLVAGQCTGEQNLKHLPMHSFYHAGTLDECKWCIANRIHQEKNGQTNKHLHTVVSYRSCSYNFTVFADEVRLQIFEKNLHYLRGTIFPLPGV